MGVNVGKSACSLESGVADADPNGTVSGAEIVLDGVGSIVAVDGFVGVSVGPGVALPIGALHARPIDIKNETIKARNRRFD
jgi:hypothetical protein